ncbi:heavy-metal-associated domain-containing protein [Gaiella sp.]|uniref:heavy-metal-associated domain-containing protein n=1 Tax=Gaiella sp. TaxID=2663207 RepID=UPI0039834A38
MTSEILIYSVPGVTCEHCRTAITKEVGMIPGVEDVQVDLEQKLVTVGGPADIDAAVRAAIDEAGYDVDESQLRAPG